MLIETEPEEIYLTLSFRKDDFNTSYVISLFSEWLSPSVFEASMNYLCISSEKLNLNNELSIHLDWLFNFLESSKQVIQTLRDEGVTMDLSCYWRAKSSNTGPMLSKEEIKKLANYDLDIWFDIYF